MKPLANLIQLKPKVGLRCCLIKRLCSYKLVFLLFEDISMIEQALLGALIKQYEGLIDAWLDLYTKEQAK